MGSLIGEKTTSEELRSRPPYERFSKRILAESAARQVRDHKLPVPDFCKQLFIKIEGLLQK